MRRTQASCVPAPKPRTSLTAASAGELCSGRRRRTRPRLRRGHERGGAPPRPSRASSTPAAPRTRAHGSSTTATAGTARARWSSHSRSSSCDRWSSCDWRNSRGARGHRRLDGVLATTQRGRIPPRAIPPPPERAGPWSFGAKFRCQWIYAALVHGIMAFC
jgi:hypothetical protein